MSDVLITPLMNLPNPVPGVDEGPDYATNLYNSLNIIDGHNHSAGSGNQVNTSGILINADLPFNTSYNATLIRSVRFAAQVSPIGEATDLGCAYVSGVDLWFNDGNGNQVQITSGGNVNATSSGISDGTASAAFSAGVLIVNSNTNTPANIQCGSVLIGEPTVSPNFITVASPTSLAASYSFVLPTALPGARSFLTLDASGNSATGVAYTGGLTTSNLSGSAGILKTQIIAVGQVESVSSDLYSTSSTSVQTVITTASLTVVGKPVMLILQNDGTSNLSSFVTATHIGKIRLTRDVSGSAVELADYFVPQDATVSTTFSCIDTSVTAGAHTWSLQVFMATSGGSIQVNRYKLFAYEMT